MRRGYTGCILRVDLSAGICKKEKLNEEWARLYYGARGLGVRYMLEEVAAGINPLDPENRLVFLTGPLTGTLAPSTGKLAVITKSLATGTILNCSVGGSICNAIKLAGYDGIIVQGKSSVPVYIDINGESVTIKDASELWNKGSHDTEFTLVDQLGEDTSVISIGPAGENCVPFACITSDFYRQAGRGGAGAVMGSKNLKAIAVRGYQGFRVADMKNFVAKIKEYVDRVLPLTASSYEIGTPILVELCNNAGILPTYNFKYGNYDEYKSINADAVIAARKGKKGCMGCPIGCGNYIKIGRVALEGPEYETLALCGSNCGISDLEAISDFNKQCDDLGMDTISAGNVVGLAMDMTERGIKDYGIRFGDVKAYLSMPKKLAFKQDIGAELSMGVKEICSRYNTNLGMEVKGLELPGYDPRGSWGMGLAYATSDRGGCHMIGFTVGDDALGKYDPFTGKEKAALTIVRQNRNSIKWSLPICDFWPANYEDMAWLMSLVSGEEIDAKEMENAGERIYNLSRLFNIREGFRRDELPTRIFDEPLKGTGPASGKKFPREVFEEMLSEFYSLRGWDENGIPQKDKLIELKLDKKAAEIIEDLKT
jgi:aldehyde:ferredoxin oxidoreductase